MNILENYLNYLYEDKKPLSCSCSDKDKTIEEEFNIDSLHKKSRRRASKFIDSAASRG